MSFLKSLERSAIGRQVLEEERAEIQARRVKLADELQELRAGYETALEPLLVADKEAQAKVEEAYQVFQQARKAQGETMIACAGCSSNFEWRRLQIERDLQASASPLIDEFITRLRALHEKVGLTPIPTINPPMQGSVGQFGPSPEDVQRIGREVAQRKDRMQRILDCISVVAGLKLEPLTEEELTKKLDTIRRLVDKV